MTIERYCIGTRVSVTGKAHAHTSILDVIYVITCAVRITSQHGLIAYYVCAQKPEPVAQYPMRRTNQWYTLVRVVGATNKVTNVLEFYRLIHTNDLYAQRTLRFQFVDVGWHSLPKPWHSMYIDSTQNRSLLKRKKLDAKYLKTCIKFVIFYSLSKKLTRKAKIISQVSVRKRACLKKCIISLRQRTERSFLWLRVMIH